MAETDLSLLNKVELRFALAKTDEKLSSMVASFLPPVLLKLASPYTEVRDKVVEICQHINVRINSNQIQLPVETLLKQIHTPKVPAGSELSMLRSFSLMYIRMGIKRLPVEKQSELIPLVVSSIADLSDAHAGALFNILLNLLPNLKLPERGTTESDNLKSVFGFDTSPRTEEYLAQKFALLFLLDLNLIKSPKAKPPFRSPGLTPDDCAFLTLDSKETFTTASFIEAKEHAVRFLLSGAFAEEHLYLPLLFASHDVNLSVNRPADNAFKKLKLDLEDPVRIQTLARFYLGSREIRMSPVSELLQVHILQILSKSTYAANFEPKQVVMAAISSQYYRLVQTGFTFLRTITSKTEQEILTPFSSELLEQVKSVIIKTGWPRMVSGDSHSMAFRPLAYQAIGSLIGRVPALLTNLKYFDFLLQSLEQDSVDLKPSIQEALAEILPAIDKLSIDVKKGLKSSLFRILSNPSADDSSKHIAVKVAVRSFPFSDPTARLLCLLGLRRENRPDVIEEAKRGLHPYWFKTVNTVVIDEGDAYEIKFPSFVEMAELVKDTSVRFQSASYSEPTVNGYFLSVYNSITVFLEQIFIMEAVQGHKTALVIDESWDTRIEAAIDMDETVRGLVVKSLSDLASGERYEHLLYFLQLAFDGLVLANTEVEKCATIWLRILSLSSSQIITQLQPAVEPLVNLLSQPKPAVREIASFGLGIIVSSSASEFDSASTALLTSLNEYLTTETKDVTYRNIDRVHGSAVALATIISRLFIRQRLGAIDLTGKIFETFSEILPQLLSESKNLPLVDAAVTAISQLSIYGALASKPSTYFDSIKEKLVVLATKKESEKSVLALGYLSLSDGSFLLSDENDDYKSKEFYVEKLISLTQSKHAEYMFSSGEALSVVAAGWNSKVLNRSLDVQDTEKSLLPRSTLSPEASYLTQTLDKVLESTRSPKPALRKFACIWLISLLQYCGHLEPVQAKLELIHVTFMRYLPEVDELVQESASRGLSMVYEMGDAKLKDTLVRSLVGSFTADSTRKVNAGAVSADTQLFEPGVLNTGDGSVSTYKDILNLASELGDPSLIYRFMSLAANSALWSSRKGAAFGLGSILAKANLDEMLEGNQRLSQSLIPKLYRYRFDPNSSVQQAMRSIWDSLVKDKAAAIKNNFEPILKELLAGMGDKEWRVRQASAAALADLLQGKPIELYQNYLEEIWQMSFRSVDDIKDSVRTAGMALTRSLATSLIRYVDVDNGASPQRAGEILTHLIPFLMGHQGLQSDAQDIQSFALDTLIKLSKKGGTALRPFIPSLVEELLLLMSTLEPQAINYIALNADKYGLTNNAIDASRLASIRGSPIMDAIEQLVDQATDEETMAALVPRIATAIRKSVGLPSKVASSRVIVALTMRHMQTVAPFADQLLVASQRQIQDRSDTISQSFAASCGYLCRLASDKAVIKYITDLQEQYFTGETERARKIPGYSINAISKHAADKFQNLASSILPFVFIAKHDPEKGVEEQFGLVWSDNTGGSGAIRLYIKEILDMAGVRLTSQQWIIRQVAAQSVADASNTISDDLLTSSGVIGIDVAKLFDVLLEACTGRSWSGKEQVLRALVLLASKAKSSYVSVTPGFVGKLSKVVVTEAKRRNKEYQVHSLPCLGEFLHSYPQESLYETLYELCDAYLDPEVDSDEDSDMSDGEEDGKNAGGANSLGAGILSKRDIEKEETRNKVLGAIVSSFVFGEEESAQGQTASGALGGSGAGKRKFYSNAESTVKKTCFYLGGVLLSSLEEDSPGRNAKELRRKRRKLGPVSWRTKQAAAKHFSQLISKEYLAYLEQDAAEAASGGANVSAGTASSSSNGDAGFGSTLPLAGTKRDGEFFAAFSAAHITALEQVWAALLATAAVDQNHEMVRIEAAIAAGTFLSLLNAIVSNESSGAGIVKTAEAAKLRLLGQVADLKEREQSNVVKTRLSTVSSV